MENQSDPENDIPAPVPRDRGNAVPSAAPAPAVSALPAAGPGDPMAASGFGDQLGDELSRILEIPLQIHVELGRRRMRISELMEVGVGSVVELETAAGASLSIFANQTLVAEGEAVVVGERYGIRITDIVAPEERVRRLGGGAS